MRAVIVNKTTYTEEDMKFIYSHWKAPKKKKDVYMILSLLVDVLMIFWGIHCIRSYKEFDTRLVPVWFPLFIILMLLLPLHSIFSVVKRAVRNKKKSTDWAAKLRAVSEERTFTFSEECAEVRSVTDGVEYIKKYGYDKLTRLYVGDDRIYPVMRTNNNDIYMPVHDDGYVEGSKEELISLLESHGVRREEI